MESPSTTRSSFPAGLLETVVGEFLEPIEFLSDDDVEQEVDVAAPPSVSRGPEAKVVLVVEDDDAIRELIVRGLGTRFTVFEVADGAIAHGMLERMSPPDAIVCDVTMPRVDGLQLAREIKKIERLRSIPIVFLTARNSTMDIVSGINAGARHYLTKPFKLKELLDKVTAVAK
ncbi:MAG: response regulator [Myxococcales bacterium]